ncbi:MAG: cryptochrome/photolyase family protein [Alphaproteobacteria bacterium]|nr:cryptochrome/photolyase family protein [Rhizobiaceae bacterium]MBU3959937.1 cryptochrome/photolyase family protein [Alphaproteobacteria bacterium]MBU4050751.1 cryptochrome/photolyase family protein [Alphaproteobacteria bacterium]MBU4089592.1 cryptochrome/photolyase family protein [Alphaproteobacteria bacterium]MBU4155472.1 cryptochrome/photolyase family protein [Alphaproteobacteria bacterium]
MTLLHLVLGDQLSHSLSALRDASPQGSIVLMAEVMAEASYVRHHQKKIAFLFSAMRHFAEELRARGLAVRYVRLDDPDNSQSLLGEVERALAETGAEGLVVTEPGEYRLMEEMRGWQERLGVPVEIREDDRFLISRAGFDRWADRRRELRMEYFYRDMRRHFGVLMRGDEPEGGQWNFDKENRKSPPKGLKGPRRLSWRHDAITCEVLDLVETRFSHHIGRLRPFHFAVTAREAEAEFEQFVTEILPSFGDWQDAMVSGEPYLFHSMIAAYLNAGLLLPIDVIRRAERAYHEGTAPLNAVEGFIRQILGWREYVRGIYWRFMPDYAGRNALDAHRPLPALYWSGETKMRCMAAAVGDTIEHAYSHHIQRLMVTGNFALIAGLSVEAVCEWYLAVYADAYEWVELPNTLGMALCADGGLMASKPYAASGKYIDRMSNFCGGCSYDVKDSTGESACPFNSLYWRFIAVNEDKLRGNHRMANILAGWRRMDEGKKTALLKRAEDCLALLEKDTL